MIRGMGYTYVSLVDTCVYTDVYSYVSVNTDVSVVWVICIWHYPYIQVYIKMWNVSVYIQIYPWDELHVFLEDTIRIYRCILRCICIYTDVSMGWVYIQMYPWVTVSGHIHHPDIAPQGSETSASQTHFIPSPCSDTSLRLCRNTTMVTSHWLVCQKLRLFIGGYFAKMIISHWKIFIAP